MASQSSGRATEGENGNRTEQNRGWENEKAEFFFFFPWENRSGVVGVGNQELPFLPGWNSALPRIWDF